MKLKKKSYFNFEKLSIHKKCRLPLFTTRKTQNIFSFYLVCIYIPSNKAARLETIANASLCIVI